MAKYITIVGGGVIGLSTALALILKGAHVTLLDAEDGVGQGASFANGGQLSYRYVSPLADRGVIWQGIKWMGRVSSPLNMRLQPSLSQWRWLLQFMRACNEQQHQITEAHLLRLSLYSQSILTHWRREILTQDFYWQRSGKLILHRSAQDFSQARMKVDSEFQQILNADEVCELEPALIDIRSEIQGGIYAPFDETADSYAYCLSLLDYLQHSSQFTLVTNCKVNQLVAREGRVVALQTSQGEMFVKHVVICAGNESRALVKPLKIDLPIYPLKGYSLTLENAESQFAAQAIPTLSVTDYAHKTVYAQLGDRLRIATMVDIGYDKSGVRTRRIDALKTQVQATFPEIKELDQARAWSGLRPATPKGAPILGRTQYRNLWLNVGHGSLGFTLAAGSANIVADLITDFRSSINLEGLSTSL